ncbi:MAG: hypothetical protein M1550_05350 [Deltaproteobacteria bacterium]|nr:hypothetical protein [Deltaproteobacteria bacterium]
MLREREKIFLAAGTVAAAVILLLSFAIIPGAGRIRTQSRAAALAEEDLAELRKMRPDVERLDRAIRARMGLIQAQANAPESPLTRLTNTLQEAGFPQQAVSVKSGGSRDGEFVREESFDLKVENLTFLEAVRLVNRLESGALPIVIRSAKMKARYDDSRYLDATFRIGFLLPRSR